MPVLRLLQSFLKLFHLFSIYLNVFDTALITVDKIVNKTSKIHWPIVA